MLATMKRLGLITPTAFAVIYILSACGDESGAAPGQQGVGGAAAGWGYAGYTGMPGGAGGAGGMAPVAGMPGMAAVAGSAGTPPVPGTAGTPPVAGMAGTPPVAGVAGTPPVAGMAGTPPVGGMAGTLPVAGMAGLGGVGGVGGAGGAGGADECVKGVVSPSQVILIGDSYLAMGGGLDGIGGIQRQIETRAVADGVLASGEHYRHYYVSGTRFLDGSIQRQYTTARSEDPDIKVVIMDGGGNDVLLAMEGCSILNQPSDPVCIEVVERSTAASSELMAEMQADGVIDVVFFFYPETPIAPGHSIFDEPYAIANCDKFTDPTECHFVSTIAAFEGHPEYIGGDAIHPSAAGQVVIGDLIWDKMVADCVAQ